MKKAEIYGLRYLLGDLRKSVGAPLILQPPGGLPTTGFLEGFIKPNLI
jgi:hypothetical protein